MFIDWCGEEFVRVLRGCPDLEEVGEPVYSRLSHRHEIEVICNWELVRNTSKFTDVVTEMRKKFDTPFNHRLLLKKPSPEWTLSDELATKITSLFPKDPYNIW